MSKAREKSASSKKLVSSVTRNRSVTLTGSAEAGAAVKIYDRDKRRELGSVTAHPESGEWSITLTLADTRATPNTGIITSGGAEEIVAFSNLIVNSVNRQGDGSVTVTGQAEPGALVFILSANGASVLEQVRTNSVTGAWRINFQPGNGVGSAIVSSGGKEEEITF